MRYPMIVIVALASTTAGLAEASDFNLEYRVDRADSARMSLDRCADIVQGEAKAAGYTQTVSRYPGQLVTVTGGPGGGGSSFIVHCIAVDQKTVSVVQAIDYRGRQGATARFADRVQAALAKAVQ